MRSSGNVGQSKGLAGQIIVAFRQPVDIFQMKIQIVQSHFKHAGIRCQPLAETLVNLFNNHVAVNFAIKFNVKPFRQPADFGPGLNFCRQQFVIFAHFLQKLANGIIS